MIDRPIKFDARQARLNRDRAMLLASQGKDEWNIAAKWVLYDVALRVQEFTTDALWRAGLEECPNGSNRALGPVMLAASRAGIISSTDRTKPTDKAHSHAQPIRVWRSNIFGPSS